MQLNFERVEYRAIKKPAKETGLKCLWH